MELAGLEPATSWVRSALILVTARTLTRRPPGAHRRGGDHGSRGAAPAASVGSGVAVADELRRLRPRLVSGLLHDRRHLRIRDEALPALLVPVEDDPHPILLGGIAEDRRAF